MENPFNVLILIKDVKVNYNMKFTDTLIGSLTSDELGLQRPRKILRGDMVFCCFAKYIF